MSFLRSLLDASKKLESNFDSEQPFLLISDVAERVDLEPKTIRFYEKSGLLKPRRVGKFRVFTLEDVEILLLIKKFRQYDMPITQVREVLELHHQHGNERNHRLQAILKTQRETLLNKHRELAEHIAILDFTLSSVADAQAA